uniref:Uncharacterized protein n=1 Tax=viral metagenome TaxID=1070528 RepID=A0A6C0HDT9_9ZZZZ
MARTMKRKMRTNKKKGNRVSKKVYKKRNLKSLRKTTKRGRRKGSRKMLGGNTQSFDANKSVVPSFNANESFIPPFDANESAIFPQGDEGHFHDDNGDLNLSFGSIVSDDTIQPDELNMNITVDTDEGDTTEETNSTLGSVVSMDESQEGGRKGKITQKRRRGKKGGENLPPTFNPYIDKVYDADHD